MDNHKRPPQPRTTSLLVMIDRTIVYLYATKEYPLTYGPSKSGKPVVTAYCDSNYAAREQDSRSRGGGSAVDALNLPTMTHHLQLSCGGLSY